MTAQEPATAANLEEDPSCKESSDPSEQGEQSAMAVSKPTTAHLTHTCLFCNPDAHGQEDQVLLRSKNFLLFAGLGPILQDYIIIAPQRCELEGSQIRCISDLPRELLDELFFLRTLVSRFYRDVSSPRHPGLAFEHGRGGTCLKRTSDTKHCYHAHLCCYPGVSGVGYGLPPMDVEKPLHSTIALSKPLIVEGLFQLREVVGSNPYLYLEQCFVDNSDEEKPSERWEHVAFRLSGEQALESQYLRRLLASWIRKPELWSWEDHPMLRRVYHLRQRFTKWILRDPRSVVSDADGNLRIDFPRSIEQSTLVGTDSIARHFYSQRKGANQYGAVGRFLCALDSFVASHSRPDLRSVPRVLDVGCGPGFFTTAFAELGLDCVGVDASNAMLDLAQTHGRGSAASSLLTFRKGTLREIAESPEPFDGIWCSALFVHLPTVELLGALSDLRTLLIPGGVLFISLKTGEGAEARPEGRYMFHHSHKTMTFLCSQVGFEMLDNWTDTTVRSSKRIEWRHYLLRKSKSRS